MGTAEVLTGMRARIPGTVKFIFQPAEEVPPRGGALPLIEAGVMDGVDGIFGLHVFPGVMGSLQYRAGPSQASADNWKVIVRGKQGHGAMPASAIDPIVIGAQIVSTFQTIVSRQIDLTTSPAVLTVGAFHGGVRENIIPDSVWMIGTVRTFDEGIRGEIHARMTRTATMIAEASGATAEVTIVRGYPVTVNHPPMVTQFLPTLQRVAGRTLVTEGELSMPAEDFSRYAEKAPAFFVGLGVTPPDLPPANLASNHSPFFQADDRALPVGVRTLANLAVDFLRSGGMRLVP
jgi:amidohydrolase